MPNQSMNSKVDIATIMKAEMTEYSAVAVLAYTSVSHLIYCNLSARQLCGVTESDELNGSNFPKIIPQGRRKSTPIFDYHFGTAYSEELFVEVKPAKIVPCIVNKQTLKQSDNSNELSFYYITDITEMYSYRGQLETSNIRLSEANRVKQEFLAHMSHELRTPLNAIIGFSEMIEKQVIGPVGDARYIGYAGDIRESGYYLLDLVNDLLDLSKIEADKYQIIEEEIDIVRLLESCMNMVSTQSEVLGLEQNLLVEGEIPPLYADERIVRQATLNILSNAQKFTPKGGTVTIEVGTGSSQCLMIKIRDTGIGIAKDDVPKVMSVFGQVSGSSKSLQKGTGLGLPLAKKFIELHGGSLTLDSDIGVGTVVSMRFPAERVLHESNG